MSGPHCFTGTWTLPNSRSEEPKTPQRVVHVIDDDDAVRESMAALLEINGYAVAPHASAAAFLDERPDNVLCLLLDVEMPGMTGPELVRVLADRDALPPTVLVTAHSEHRSARDTLALGVRRILGKPCAESDLLAAITDAVGA